MRASIDSHSMRRRQRGSVLIVALILAAVIAISLTSYIQLATTASRIAYRGHYAGVAMNAAESGLEHAMWAINKKKTEGVHSVWSDEGWDTTDGTTARRTFDLGNVSGGSSVVVKVLVSDRHLTTENPYAIARAIVTPPNGSAVEKWIKISLSQRSLGQIGALGEEGVENNGNNIRFDSYNSLYGGYGETYTTTDGTTAENMFATGSVGTPALNKESLVVGNADVYGNVSIGTKDYSGLKIKNGRVGDFNADAGDVDYSRVTTNFVANLADVEIPEATTLPIHLNSIEADTTLPKSLADPTITLPDGTVAYYYTADKISLSGKTLNISPGKNVALVVDGTISVTGDDGAINVNTDPSATAQGTLNLYVSGNVTISGKGAINTGRPQNMLIWGTGDTTQTIKASGNASLTGVVYAPNAIFEGKGGGGKEYGHLEGMLIARKITMAGNYQVHYDLSLADLDTGEPLGIDQWDEFVTSVDRSTVGDIMDF
jgi:Tfp pilus assembly protein PilX